MSHRCARPTSLRFRKSNRVPGLVEDCSYDGGQTAPATTSMISGREARSGLCPKTSAAVKGNNVSSLANCCAVTPAVAPAQGGMDAAARTSGRLQLPELAQRPDTRQASTKILPFGLLSRGFRRKSGADVLLHSF